MQSVISDSGSDIVIPVAMSHLDVEPCTFFDAGFHGTVRPSLRAPNRQELPSVPLATPDHATGPVGGNKKKVPFLGRQVL